MLFEGAFIKLMAMLFENLFYRFWSIINAPFTDYQLIWISLPVIFSLLLIEFYFGSHFQKELGKNAFLINNLILVFVGVDLLRIIFDRYENTNLPLVKIIISVLIILSGLIFIYLEFYIKHPFVVNFVLSNIIPINMLVYLFIVLVYKNIKITLTAILVITIIIISTKYLSKIIHLNIKRVTKNEN